MSFFNLEGPDLFVVLAIVLIVFGPKRLPGLGKAIGTTIREFRENVKGLGDVLEEDTKKPAPPAQAAPPVTSPVAPVTTVDQAETPVAPANPSENETPKA